MLDTHNLLSHSLAKLSDETKVDSIHVPERSGSGHKGKGADKKSDQEFKDKILTSFSALAISQVIKELRQEKSE